METRHEVTALTGLRGVAAIYVVFYHYFIPLGEWRNPEQTLIGHGYLAVDLFFVLSGFVLALNYGHLFEAKWSMRTYLTFLGRRIARIYPLYVATLLIAFVLLACGLLTADLRTGLLPNLFVNILMIQSWWGNCTSLDAPAWSVSTEWAAYLMFPVLIRATLFHSWSAAAASTFIALFVLAVLCVLPPSLRRLESPQPVLDFFQPHLGLSLYRCLAEFTLGLVAFRVSESALGPRIGNNPWLSWSSGLLILVFLVIPKTDFLIVITIPVFLICLTYSRELPQRMLSSSPAIYAGRLSYSLYVSHGLASGLISWVHRFVNSFGLSHGQSYGAISAILVTIPASILLYHVIELPGRRYLRNLFERRAAVHYSKI